MNRNLSCAVLMGSMLLARISDATITDIRSPRDPEFRFTGGLGISTKGALNHSWVQVRFGELGIAAIDLTVDSPGVVTMTIDGNIAPPENFPLRRPTGVFNMTAQDWRGYLATIEALEVDDELAGDPFFLPTTELVSSHFQIISGLGTDAIRMFDGVVPADPTPGTMPGAAVLYWNAQISLPSAGKYRFLQWPSVTAIPEPGAATPLWVMALSMSGWRRQRIRASTLPYRSPKSLPIC